MKQRKDVRYTKPGLLHLEYFEFPIYFYQYAKILLNKDAKIS